MITGSRACAREAGQQRVMPQKDRKPMNRKLILNFVVGVFILWGISYSTICANVPKIYSPFSFTVAIPTLSLYSVFGSHPITFVLGSFCIPLAFILWSLPLMKGQQQIPKRTKIAAIVLVLPSLYLLASSWSFGVAYQGKSHTITMYLFNVIFWVGLFTINYRNAKLPSYASNFAFHWVLFAWLGWVAFPWLGELI